MSFPLIAKATPRSLDIPDGSGWTPLPTSVLLSKHHQALKRAEDVVDNTCGWINGDKGTLWHALESSKLTGFLADNPLTCESDQACLFDRNHNAMGCCWKDNGGCGWGTSCIPQ